MLIGFSFQWEVDNNFFKISHLPLYPLGDVSGLSPIVPINDPRAHRGKRRVSIYTPNSREPRISSFNIEYETLFVAINAKRSAAAKSTRSSQ